MFKYVWIVMAVLVDAVYGFIALLDIWKNWNNRSLECVDESTKSWVAFHFAALFIASLVMFIISV